MSAGKNALSSTVDGNFLPQKVPVDPVRSTFQGDMERIQSGGLSDDPTESGDPVIDGPKPFKNLKGNKTK